MVWDGGVVSLGAGGIICRDAIISGDSARAAQDVTRHPIHKSRPLNLDRTIVAIRGERGCRFGGVVGRKGAPGGGVCLGGHFGLFGESWFGFLFSFSDGVACCPDFSAFGGRLVVCALAECSPLREIVHPSFLEVHLPVDAACASKLLFNRVLEFDRFDLLVEGRQGFPPVYVILSSRRYPGLGWGGYHSGGGITLTIPACMP
jgi:hypothetical protein